MSHVVAVHFQTIAVASELHRDWRNDVEGLATLLNNHIPDYRNRMNSFAAMSKTQ